MLHILLLILKIIGIILAVILGIIVLVICSVLFIPICYRAEGESKGTLDDARVHAKVTWLFGLVKMVVDIKNKTVDYDIRIAWKRLGDISESDEERGDIAYEEECDFYSEDWKETNDGKRETESEPHEKDCLTFNEKCPQDAKAPKEKPAVSEESEKAITKSYTPDEEDTEAGLKKPGIFEKAGNKIHDIGAKTKRSFEKIKCTFRQFCDKIKEILGKKDQVVAFITDEVHLHALKKAKQEVFKLLRRVSPRTLKANIRYGFEDPCLTGQVLAALSILYPFIGGHTQITPDFQEKVLEGDIKIKGRIFVVHLAALVVNMLLCRDVRRMIKDVKEFKL